MRVKGKLRGDEETRERGGGKKEMRWTGYKGSGKEKRE